MKLALSFLSSNLCSIEALSTLFGDINSMLNVIKVLWIKVLEGNIWNIYFFLSWLKRDMCIFIKKKNTHAKVCQ